MKIHNKLFFIFFSFSLLLVTALVLLIQWSIGKGLVDYVNNKEIEALKPLISQLQTEYKKNNSWSLLQGEDKKFGALLFSNAQTRGRPGITSPNNRPPPPKLHPLSPPPRQASHALLDAQNKLVAGHYIKEMSYNKIAIDINQLNIGWLMVPKHTEISEGYELNFIDQQSSYLWIIALTTMLLVALITFPLAFHLADPIKRIMLGMHRLTQGDYQQHININRKDELGELSRDFNELAFTLNENENARKRWLANISHELRTPVAILRAELEAMLDGVRALETKNINSANDEVKHLQNLIDDLHQLTSADVGGLHYRKQTTNIASWLEREREKYGAYLSAENIELNVDIESTEVEVFVDQTRLCQLLENLLNNCIKYAQANIINISLKERNKFVIITIEDDGVGVKDKHLAHLFEYLYRVEDSRNRKTGGTGLGLSICAHIVAAHQGKILAQSSALGGLAIIIELPIQA